MVIMSMAHSVPGNSRPLRGTAARPAEDPIGELSCVVTADSTSFDRFARASANDRVDMFRILAHPRRLWPTGRPPRESRATRRTRGSRRRFPGSWGCGSGRRAAPRRDAAWGSSGGGATAPMCDGSRPAHSRHSLMTGASPPPLAAPARERRTCCLPARLHPSPSMGCVRSSGPAMGGSRLQDPISPGRQASWRRSHGRESRWTRRPPGDGGRHGTIVWISEETHPAPASERPRW